MSRNNFFVANYVVADLIIADIGCKLKSVNYTFRRTEKELTVQKRSSSLKSPIFRRDILIIILGTALLVAAYEVCSHEPSLNAYLVLMLYLVPYVVCGFNTLLSALECLLGGSLFKDEFLIVLATIGMFCAGFYAEAVGTMIIYRCVSCIMQYAKRKYSKRPSGRRNLPRSMRSGAKNPASAEVTVERISRIFTPVFAVSGLLLALIPSVIDGEWSTWLPKGAILILAACTCSLISSVELCFSGGIMYALSAGAAVGTHSGLEDISNISTLALDKTGTVTEGSFTVTQVEPVGISSADLLTLAAAAESDLDHPIADALRRACPKLPPRSLIKNVRELPGRGMEAMVCGKRVLLGNAALMNAHGISVRNVKTESTIIHLAADGRYGGYIVIDDRIRSGAKSTVRKLRELGIENAVMLTGDSEGTGSTLGYALGANDVIAELLPEEKAIAVKELRRSTTAGLVAFVGDDERDASALGMADVSIATGAYGDSRKVRTAYLLDDDISRLPLLIYAAKRSQSAAKQNLALALTVKSLVIILALCGVIGIWFAAAADGAALMFCGFNALRTSKPQRGDKK